MDPESKSMAREIYNGAHEIWNLEILARLDYGETNINYWHGDMT